MAKLTLIVSIVIYIVSLIIFILSITQSFLDRSVEQWYSNAPSVVKQLFQLDTNPAERDQCIMTWMHPNYIPLEVPEHKLSHKYKLYLYREGSPNFKLSGVPVLFVHGHAGVFKQARSLGPSVDKAKQKQSPFTDSFIYLTSELHELQIANGSYVPIDIFTIDFKEEFSGFHGTLLWDQANYLNHCLQFILKQYKTGQKSVIILGHSMGGMVARAAPLLPNYNSGSINTIITLSTPHREPPLFIDSSIYSFYRKVNNKWSTEKEKFSDMSIASISNGFRDTLIRADTTYLDGIVSEENSLSVSLYSIQNVRVSADHLSITWCRQLYNVLGNTILDLVNSNANSKRGIFDAPLKERMRILRQHLLESPTYKVIFGISQEKSLTIPSTNRHELIGTNTIHKIDSTYYSFHSSNPLKSNSFYELNVTDKWKQEKDSVAIMSNFGQDKFNVYGVKKDEEGVIYSFRKLIESLPFVRVNKKHTQDESINDIAHALLFLPNSSLQNYQSLLLHFKEVKHQDMKFTTTFFSSRESKREFTGGSLLKLLKSTIILHQKKADHTGIYNITMLNYPRQYSYRVRSSYDKKCEMNHLYPVAYYYYIDKYPRFEDHYIEDARDFKVRFFHSNIEHDGFNLVLYTDPKCPIKVQIQLDILETFAQIIRFNASPIFASLFAILLLAISHQISNDFNDGITGSIIAIFTGKIIPILLILCPAVFYFSNTNKETSWIANFIATISENIGLQGWMHTPSLHQDDPIFVAFVGLFAFALLLSIAIIQKILVILLSLPIFIIGKILQLILVHEKVIGTVWYIAMNALSALALLRIHSGIPLSLGILLMLANISYRFFVRRFKRRTSEADRITDNCRSGILLYCIVIALLVVPQTIVYLKEWNLRVTAGLSSSQRSKGTLSNLSLYSELIISQMPERYFADTQKLLLLPVMQCFAFYFNNWLDPSIRNIKKNIKGFMQFIFQYAAYYILIYARHRLYTCIYVLFSTSLLLLVYGYGQKTNLWKQYLSSKRKIE